MTTVSIRQTLGVLPSNNPGPPLSFEELGAYLRAHCDQLDEKHRNERHCVRDELYRDGGVDWMKSQLGKYFRDPDVLKLRQEAVEHSRFNNPLKRIVNEISTVYAEPAERHIANGDDVYQRVLELIRMDEQMLQGSRLLSLHRAILMAPRVRVRPDGSREPVIDHATPGNARAVTHPNDPCMVVGWLIRAATKPARLAIDLPAWTLWTDHERVQLRQDMSPILSTYLVHGLGVNPWVPVSLGPPIAGFWPGQEGEDLVSAHVAIWLSNILLLKEQKSATKVPVITGDTSNTARSQMADTEGGFAIQDGTGITTIDLSMDLDMFTKTSDHILEHVAQNYGMSAALINQQGVQSADARELMRIPLRELRKHQQVPLRRFERDFAIALAAVLRVDLPELAFSPDGWRIKFGESQAPLSRAERLKLFIAERTAGTTDTIEFLEEEHDMTPEEARAAIIVHAEVERFRQETTRGMPEGDSASTTGSDDGKPKPAEDVQRDPKPDNAPAAE
jgi:hypothetical protein